MVTFSNTESHINLKQIEELEDLVKLNFPEDYKKHLLNFNGGQCTPNIFKFTENGKITESNIDWFLAIYEGEYDNLRNYIEIYKIESKRLPMHILPIAHDPGGNLICISCGDKDFGSVYFWDHEKETHLDSNNDGNLSLYFISENFNKFINELY